MATSQVVFETPAQERNRTIGNVVWATPAQNRLRVVAQLARAVVGVLMAQRDILVGQTGDPTPKRGDETNDAFLAAVLESSLASRQLWADVAATLIQIGNGGGNAVINLLAGGSQDLTLGARGATVALNDASNLTPNAGTSLVGAINLALAGSGVDGFYMLPYGGVPAIPNDHLRPFALAEGSAINGSSRSGFYDPRLDVILPSGGNITQVGWVSDSADATTLLRVTDGGSDAGNVALTGQAGTLTGLSIAVSGNVGLYYFSGTLPGNTLVTLRYEPS